MKGRLLTKEDLYRQEAFLKRNYGLTLREYNKLYVKQDGCCAICGRHQQEIWRTLCVDHDHKTGKIRGLLCSNCNTALGLFQERRGLLFKAMQYLGRKK